MMMFTTHSFLFAVPILCKEASQKQVDHGIVHVATLQLCLQETVDLLDSYESVATWLWGKFQDYGSH